MVVRSTVKSGRRVHQRAKGPIDPRLGERIRELRIARGLTQADLAGTDFSKGFISLLETGRTRASLRAAEILAHRLGTSAAELVATGETSGSELELLLLRAEQQVSSGLAADAIEVLDSIVARAKGMLHARALRTRGRALVEAGRPRDGLTSLEGATHEFQALGQRELYVRILYDRANAHAHLNEPGNALALAAECEAAMRAGGVIDRTLELQLRSLLAATFARAGDLESADLQARQALELASDVVDPQALGTLYATLSKTRQHHDDLDGALAYARKSLAVFEGVGRERAVGQLWQNLGAIYLQRRDFARAEHAIGRAERIARDAKIPSLDARVLSLRAELAAAQRRWAQAESHASAAVAHPGASPYTRGRALLVKARVLASRRAPLRVLRETLDSAVKAMTPEPPRVQAEAHQAYAELLSARGDWKGAYEQAALALQRTGMKFR